MKFDLTLLEQKLGGWRRSRDNLFLAKCPIHDDQNSSLAVNLRANGDIYFYCFAGCQHKDICNHLQLNNYINVDKKPDTKPDYLDYRGGCAWLEGNWNQFYLSEEHKEYLKSRNIDYNKFKLVSTESLSFPKESDKYGFTRNGIRCKTLERNRIVIPYYKHNKLINIRTRAFRDGIKYLSMPKWPSQLFTGNLNEDYVIITEGEFKAMACIQNEINCIALPGIMSCHDLAIKYCKNKKKKFVWFDSEQKQQSRLAAIKLASKIDGEVFEIMPRELFGGFEKMDIDDAVNKMGKGILLLVNAVSP